MNIIYISSACYKENKKEIDKTAKKKLENNIIKFHNSIIEGISRQKGVKKIYSLIGLPISIKTNKKLFWSKKEENQNNIKYIQLGFINLPFLKQAIIAMKMYFYAKRLIKENSKDEELTVIYDASFVTVIPWIIRLANKKNIKTIGIFADIYDYMFDVERKSNKNIILRKLFIKKLNKSYKETNGYIFLTDYMNKLVNSSNKPYIIMEGIVDINTYKQKECDKYNKTILYAGGLNTKYGVKNLIEAIKEMNDTDIQLHLYGNGELENYIKNNTNERIKYFGIVDNNKILIEETKATLLINPRFSNEEYTKYSFPSKIMEYMISGTPVLTTKLQGIPEEYYKYVYTIEDESIEGIKKAIEKTMNEGEKQLYNKAKEAQSFILNNKNNIKQGERIAKLIETIDIKKEF